MSNFRLMLLSTAAAGLVAAAVSPASAGEVEKSMSVSGHVNRSIVVSDNGEKTTVSQIDNTNVSGSRFRLVGSAKSESMTIGVTTELGIQSNGGLGSETAADTTSLNIRHSFVSVGNDMGTLYVGHTWAADWLATSNSMSGTGDAGYYDGHTIGGENMHAQNNTGTGAGPTVGAITANFTGYRKNQIKYVTPSMGGFNAEVGFANQDRGAASIRYSGDFDGTKVVGTAAWGARSNDFIKAEMGGSIAVSLAGGLNGSVAYSKRDLSGNTANAGVKDPEMWGAGIGYTAGASGITAWYQNNDDIGTASSGAGAVAGNNNDATVVAVVVQHKLSDYGTTLYGGIENVSYDTTATNYDDLTAGWVGIKVTF